MGKWGTYVTLVALLAGLAGFGFGGPNQDPGDQPSAEVKKETDEGICKALCDYANAVGANTDGVGENGEPISDETKEKAASDLESTLRGCVPKGSSLHTGTCTCVGPNGETFEISYAVRHGSGNTSVSKNKDFVIAIGGDSDSSGQAGAAKAKNTGDGDALAFGGSSSGGGIGGDATAITGSGDAIAAGGQGDGTSAGGSGSAMTDTGTSTAYGGAGGNAGGSTTQAGGHAGSATAVFGGQTFSAGGLTPVPVGQHGVDSTASASPGAGSSNGGQFMNNPSS